MVIINLPKRIDGLGADFYDKLNIYLYILFTKSKLHYNIKNNGIYKQKELGQLHSPSTISEFIKIFNNFEYTAEFGTDLRLVKKCNLIEDINNNWNITDNARLGAIISAITIGTDIISYFKNNLKDLFSKNIFNNSKFIYPYKENISNIICIHLRLDDCSNIEDNDYSEGYNYIIDIINKKNIYNYSEKIYQSKFHERQHPISVNKLEYFINLFNKIYPNKNIHIVGYPMKTILNKYKYLFDKKLLNIDNVHSNEDCDIDLWYMINSDILVLSHSTFSYISGLFHKGTTVYYPKSILYGALGLGSKFDNSGWVTY